MDGLSSTCSIPVRNHWNIDLGQRDPRGPYAGRYNAGFSDTSLEEYCRPADADIRPLRICEGAAEVQKLIIGRDLIKARN
jgi:hypothetical protein